MQLLAYAYLFVVDFVIITYTIVREIMWLPFDAFVSFRYLLPFNISTDWYIDTILRACAAAFLICAIILIRSIPKDEFKRKRAKNSIQYSNTTGWKCARCGVINSSDNIFCTKCGNKIK